MLFLLFQIGGERYALDTANVLEIVPCVPLRALAHAPRGVAGLLDYHGAPIPVLDLHALMTNQPAQPRFGTRLILVQAVLSPAPEKAAGVLGLVAERATGMLRREERDFAVTGLRLSNSPWIGSVTSDAEGFIQRVSLTGMLEGGMRELLAPTGGTPLLEGRAP